MTTDDHEAGNAEFLVLAELHLLNDRTSGRPFPAPMGDESFRDAIGRRWEELRPFLLTLVKRLDEAKAQGRL